MRLEAAPVLNGFETGFTFQVTDHIRTCNVVRDAAFSTASYQSCAVAGADGFAFVVHAAPEGSAALGTGAAGLGYAGIANGVAVEFDTWYNTEPGFDDLPVEHVTIQAALPEGSPLAATSRAAVSYAAPAAIADGLVHAVRIVYYAYIKVDLVPFFTMADAGLALLVDDGESRRLGTLAVYYDNGTSPLLAIPINLNAALNLPVNQAYLVRVCFCVGRPSPATNSSWPPPTHTQCPPTCFAGLHRRNRQGVGQAGCAGLVLLRSAWVSAAAWRPERHAIPPHCALSAAVGATAQTAACRHAGCGSHARAVTSPPTPRRPLAAVPPPAWCGSGAGRTGWCCRAWSAPLARDQRRHQSGTCRARPPRHWQR